MKKFISMVMAAAMVVSLVPATAFAANTATCKVVDAQEYTVDEAKTVSTNKGMTDVVEDAEIQLKLKDIDQKNSDTAEEFEVTLEFDKAELRAELTVGTEVGVVVRDADSSDEVGTVTVKEAAEAGDTSVTLSVTEDGINNFTEGNIVVINIVDLKLALTKTGAGTKATVDVDGDFGDFSDLVFASVLDRGITASVKKLASVAEEEVVTLDKDLKIKANVGEFVPGQEFTLKLSKGFEFTKNTVSSNTDYSFSNRDDNEITLTYDGDDATDEITIAAEDIEIEAVSAKSGATGSLTVKAVKVKGNDKTFSATATAVEVVKVVDYKVELTVDEDEDVPVIYSGVDVDNTGITDDSDHLSLEVTAEETFPGAWSFRKGFNFELPEGVYVTNVKVIDTEGLLDSNNGAVDGADDVTTEQVAQAFFDAYQNGDHLNFEFDKRVFDDVDSELNEDEASMTFQLELVADPTFEGDVVLKLTGDLVDEQEVTIAKFVKPYTAKAEQNDLIIDYRYTDIPTAITITEAEAGLWEKGAWFEFGIEKGEYIQFEDDATFEVDKDSELDIDDYTGKTNAGTKADGVVGFEIDGESDEAATVTIKDMQLFMQRNIPAGPYDLEIYSSLEEAYLNQTLFAPDCKDVYDEDGYNCDGDDCTDKNNDCIVDDVCDYDQTVKEAFINVVTAGRDQDDASFTTKVVVPVGESYLISGETTVALDVPAYISAAGYTMLPVRAVATALGILNNNVLWDQATKTVTILYGQRIITMVAGQKVVYVNGSAIPASASVEIVNGRTFLPMRDLGTALGVTDITWDAATKTATLNGNQK